MASETLRPTIWSITASDSSGGAGAMADSKVAHSLGCHCRVIQIAVTAQNNHGVQAVELVSAAMREAQWQAACVDGWPAAMRLGWLPADTELLQWLLDKLALYSGPVVWDPVLAASHGAALSCAWQGGVLALRRQLLARADVITPNLAEARLLAELPTADALTSAKALQQGGAQQVLVTGGDSAHGAWVQDLFVSHPQAKLGLGQLPGRALVSAFQLRHPRLSGSAHGSGCHLAAALACALAHGNTLYDALVQATAVAHAAIRSATATHAPVSSNAWAVPLDQTLTDDWPIVIPLPFEFMRDLDFKPLERSLGLYGLVDNLEHLQRLLALGIDSLQWRVKQPDASYREQTQQAIELCRDAKVPLFINDDWRLALELNAFGVHLGQEDLTHAELNTLQQAGLALGISTHTDWEVARARGVNPSYIAFGPVYIPLSKQLKYEPIGLARLERWVQLLGQRGEQLTCIGGITVNNIDAVLASGITSAAIVTELRHDSALKGRFDSLKRAIRG